MSYIPMRVLLGNKKKADVILFPTFNCHTCHSIHSHHGFVFEERFCEMRDFLK